MKTLLLASSGYFVTNGDISFLHRPLASMNIVYVATAGKPVADKRYIEQRKKRMRELGFQFREIDIEETKGSALRKAMQEADAVYVEGGDTFYLLHAVRRSGFGRIVKQRIGEGMLYIGTSAGMYIACPTIEMATWKRPVKNRYGIRNLRALSLVPFLVVAHYSPVYKELIEEKARRCRYEVRTLSDNQALFVRGDDVTLLEEGG